MTEVFGEPSGARGEGVSGDYITDSRETGQRRTRSDKGKKRPRYRMVKRRGESPAARAKRDIERLEKRERRHAAALARKPQLRRDARLARVEKRREARIPEDRRCTGCSKIFVETRRWIWSEDRGSALCVKCHRAWRATKATEYCAETAEKHAETAEKCSEALSKSSA